MNRPEIIWNMLDGLAYDLAISDHRIPGLSVGEKIVERHAVYEVGNKAHRHDHMTYERGQVPAAHIGTASRLICLPI